MSPRGYLPTIFAVLAIGGAARAQATYPPLAPAPIRLDHNAAAIATACIDGKPKLDGAKCADYAFCKNPFDANAAVPSVDELAQIDLGHCPVSPAATSRVALTVRAQDLDAMTAAVNSVSGLSVAWQGDVLAGLANFLVARAKAELVAGFVVQLQADLCTAAVAPTLPATCGLIAGADPYAIPVSWNALRTAFATDLRDLPAAMIDRLSGDKAEPMRALAQAIVLISQGAEPLDTVAGMRAKYAAITTSVACDHAPYACALFALGNAVEILAPSPTAGAPIRDPAARTLQLKIAARLLKDVGAPIGIVGDIEARLDHYKRLLEDLIGRLASVRTAAQGAQQAAHDVPMTASRTQRAAATQPSFDHYARCVGNAFAIAPMAAVIPALAQDTSIGGFSAVIDHLGGALERARGGDYVAAFVEVSAALAAAHLPPPAWFTKYGGFLADVAAAQTPADAETAIEAAAAPVGSWRQKRGAGHRTLWINGYLGGQLGAEHLFGAGAPGGFAFHGGLFAPLGLEADLGLACTWSIGALAAALDLGALVDLRASSSTVNSNANIGARQVFSPGAYVVVGLGLGDRGVPLTAGAGISLSPELRTASVGGSARDVNAVRFNAFLAVDVSLFGL